jgi:hypothetical protein
MTGRAGIVLSLRVGAKANGVHAKIKIKIIDAPFLLLQKDSKHGFAEKSAVG